MLKLSWCKSEIKMCSLWHFLYINEYSWHMKLTLIKICRVGISDFAIKSILPKTLMTIIANSLGIWNSYHWNVQNTVQCFYGAIRLVGLTSVYVNPGLWLVNLAVLVYLPLMQREAWHWKWMYKYFNLVQLFKFLVKWCGTFKLWWLDAVLWIWK